MPTLIESMCARQISFPEGNNCQLDGTLSSLRVIIRHKYTKLNVGELSHWKEVGKSWKTKRLFIVSSEIYDKEMVTHLYGILL